MPSASDLNNPNWESASSNGLDEEADVANCVAVLDRAIAWAKARAQKNGTQVARATGAVAPIGSPIAGPQPEDAKISKEDEKNGKRVSECVTVIDKAMSAVKWRPSQGKLG